MSTNPPHVVTAQLTTLVAELTQKTPSIDAGLKELVDSALRHVPGAQYAGITMSERGEVRTLAATHQYPQDLDAIQQSHREGPCLSAAWEHHTVLLNDITTEKRWPRFTAEVAARTPIRSVLSFELATNQTAMTALNFYAEKPHAFADEAQEIGLIFATHTALAWTMLRRDDQFRSALASRDVIGQAKGMIMERYHVNAVQAFDLLRRLSQSSNCKVIDIAIQLIENEKLG